MSYYTVHSLSRCETCGEQYRSVDGHACAEMSIYDVLRTIIGKLNMTSETDVQRMMKAIQTAEDNSLFGAAGRFKL